MYLEEETKLANMQLVPLFVDRVERLDEDYLWIASESIRKAADKNVCVIPSTHNNALVID